MSDFRDDDDDSDGEQPLDPKDLRRQLKELRAAAKDANTRAEENAKAARELAFAKAGVDTDDPRARYFVQGFAGEMTPEAIRAEAQTLGLVPTPPRTPVPAAEQDATRRFSEVAAGQEAVNDQEQYEQELMKIDPRSPDAAAQVEAMSKARNSRLRHSPFG